jgi:arylsulfatase
MLSTGRGDEDVTEGEQLTMEVRRNCDREYLRRTENFVRQAVASDQPWFVYFNHSLLHFPVLAREEFHGATGAGEWADALAELDADFGRLLDLIDELAIAEDTIVVFAGDNGPEELLLWRGTPGFWEGSYFAGYEGNLRTPCIVRWPGKVLSGRVTDEIMHIVDWFTTLLHAAGAEVPADREIDGVDQLDWLTGKGERSGRDGYVYWMGPEIYGVKWRNFKLVLVDQRYSTDAPGRLASPSIRNLTLDPQEREPVSLPYLHSWTAKHFNRILGAFERSVAREPLIPAAAPVDFVPGGGDSRPG